MKLFTAYKFNGTIKGAKGDNFEYFISETEPHQIRGRLLTMDGQRNGVVSMDENILCENTVVLTSDMLRELGKKSILVTVVDVSEVEYDNSKHRALIVAIEGLSEENNATAVTPAISDNKPRYTAYAFGDVKGNIGDTFKVCKRVSSAVSLMKLVDENDQDNGIISMNPDRLVDGTIALKEEHFAKLPKTATATVVDVAMKNFCISGTNHLCRVLVVTVDWPDMEDQTEETPVTTNVTLPKDSGSTREFDTGAHRDNAEGKGRCDLLPLMEVAMVFRRAKELSVTEETASVVFAESIARFMDDHNVEHLADAIVACRAGLKEYQNHTVEYMILDVSHLFEAGAIKYGANNWSATRS